MKKAKTREEWLENAVDLLRNDLFKRHGHKVPPVRISVGFALGSRKAVGQHWHSKAADDKKGQILITPDQMDFDALDTTVHELCHAVTEGDGHGPNFKRVALSVGLVGKMRTCGAGPQLKEELEKIIKTKLGPYPHSKLNVSHPPKKPQTTRMIKMTCYSCGYICRASMSAIIEHGPVLCPCNKVRMSVQRPKSRR